ncbi:MAG TPA: HU family DNA-binding protein, partial [Acidimicrobiales bacterium]|nr:HU family DNA-binding protein [Acidimicrobiales bacterium]
MNKSQLVGSVNTSTSHSRRVVEEVVDVLFDTIVAEVRSGRKVSVIGFGTFNPIRRAARIGRNPRTGAVVPIPASKGVRFATGSTFKSALNPKEGAPMAVK